MFCVITVTWFVKAILQLLGIIISIKFKVHKFSNCSFTFSNAISFFVFDYKNKLIGTFSNLRWIKNMYTDIPKLLR